MARLTAQIGLWITTALVTAGCGVPGAAMPTRSEAATSSGPAQPGHTKRIVAAMGLEVDLQPGASGPGVRELRQLVGAGLTILDDQGERRGQLAEIFPTLENGLWRLLPDGRMETTWKLRPNGRWHDGAPFTADDVVFTGTVVQDRALPTFIDADFNGVERVEAIDRLTVSIVWKESFANADGLFSGMQFKPMPKHVLEEPYANDKAGFPNLAFWTHDYVGTGPYRVRAWVPGSHYLFEAHDEYVLGRPRIDEIELRFVRNSETRMANILGGVLDITFGPGLSVLQALDLRQQWAAGSVALALEDFWIAIHPQFVNPSPPVVGEVRFRKALMHAIDRQEMVQTLQAGLVPVAHSFLIPGQPDYQEIDARVVRYAYDPRRAAEMIEGLGYTKSGNGFYQDAAGQKLEVEIRSTEADIASKSMLSVADYWQRIGVGASLVSYTRQREADYPYSATFPSFLVLNRPNDVGALKNLLGSRARLPENNFMAPGVGNWSRYVNPEFDALIARYSATAPKQERIQVLGQIIHHISDQLNVMGLFYNPVPEPVSSRLMRITSGRAPTSRITWNVHEWDLEKSRARG